MADPLLPLTQALDNRGVRFVLIGVAGANYYVLPGSPLFVTTDHDLFLPLDPDNLVRAWAACDDAALSLWVGDEPLDMPRDRWLAERVIERKALTHARGREVLVDLTLVMKGFDFETVWSERREFQVEGRPLPVARLLHIVTSKREAGRNKDKLFLATHREELEQLFKRSKDE